MNAPPSETGPTPTADGDDGLATARVLVDLCALAENWRAIARLAAPARTAAVVKANAYGLGVGPVAAALGAAGCTEFFVAGPDEALELRALEPRATIYALAGLPPGVAPRFVRERIVPVLNATHEVREWLRVAAGLPCALQIDSGMTRSGLGRAELDELAAGGLDIRRLNLVLLLSHFASADEPGSPRNDEQLRRFADLRALLPAAPTSLGNSAGLLLGPPYRGDLVRPGLALYGGHPLPDGRPAGLREVARLQGRVLQVREVREADVTVGYGGTHRVRPPARIATVGLGYADGYLRALGGRAYAAVGDVRVPVIGRVSMDLVTLDVSAVPGGGPAPGTWVDMIGGCVPLEEVATLAGTIPYELLTRLGPRAKRVYAP
jgi:alanine racemase